MNWMAMHAFGWDPYVKQYAIASYMLGIESKEWAQWARDHSPTSEGS